MLTCEDVIPVPGLPRRQSQPIFSPGPCAQWEFPRACKSCSEARHGHKHTLPLVSAHESADMLEGSSACIDRDVISFKEKIRMTTPKFQSSVRKKKFDAPIGPVVQNGCEWYVPAHRLLKVLQETSSHFEVDGPAVIRIRHAEIPEFVALIKIRIAGRRDL